MINPEARPLGTQDIADDLGVSQTTARAIAKMLPHMLVGRFILVHASVYAAWKEMHDREQWTTWTKPWLEEEAKGGGINE